MERVSLCHGALAWGGRIYTDWEGEAAHIRSILKLMMWKRRSDFYSACGAACDFQWERGAHAVGNVCVSYGFSWCKGCGYLCHPVFESTDEPEIDPAVCNQKGHPLYEKAADLFEDINTEYDKKHPDTRLLSSHICCSLWRLWFHIVPGIQRQMRFWQNMRKS